MGGGRIMRALGQAVAGGMQGATSSAAAAATAGRLGRTSRLLSVGASSSSPSTILSLAAADGGVGWEQVGSAKPCLCGDDWESLIEEEMEEDGFLFADRLVFGPVPSKEEVAEAVSSIQQIFIPIAIPHISEDTQLSFEKNSVDNTATPDSMVYKFPIAEPQSHLIEPELQLSTTETVRIKGVADAFHSLQTNPSVQKMVVSLSSDKAVWDAVMKNDAVKELRRSFYADETDNNIITEKPDDNSDVASRIVRWILENTKAKIMDFFDHVGKIVNDLFHSEDKGKKMDAFEDAVRSSFMLSVVVFIVVVMFRVHRS